MSAEMLHGGCPVIHSDYTVDRAALSTYVSLDEEREVAPILWNDSGATPFWVVQRYDQVCEVLANTKTFSSSVIQAITPYGLNFLPNKLDPPRHMKMRKLLNAWFEPKRVAEFEPSMRTRARELITEVQGKGSCDFVAEFAIRYPTDLLLELLGMPPADGPHMVELVEQIFDGAFRGPGADQAATAIRDYYAVALLARAQSPRDPARDFLTNLNTAGIDGVPLTEAEKLDICMTMMVAGLHTTRGALGYSMYHLARFANDRTRLIADPSLASSYGEEFVRLYNLVISVGRLVAHDVDFHGVSMREGDIVWIGNASACRDPRKFDDPTRFDPSRSNLKQHVGWGYGEHRCLGMHLARMEIAVALEEWHALIPDYQVEKSEGLMEGAPQLGLRSLPLRW